MNSKKKYIIGGSVTVSVIVILALCLILIPPRYYYSQGNKMFDDGKYGQAIEFFDLAKGYQDSEEMIILSTKALNYTNGITALSNNNYSEAVDKLIKAEDYSDAKQKLQEVADKAFEAQDWGSAVLAFDVLPNSETNECRFYALGMQSMGKKEYIDALNNFKKAKSIDGVTERITEANYYQGVEDFNSANYESALEYLKQVRTYENASEYITKCLYELGKIELDKKNYKSALKYLKNVSKYENASELIIECSYELGKIELDKKNYESALKYLKQAGNYKKASKMIIECSYEVGKIEFDKKNYESALKYFKASKGYSDTADWINNVKFMTAEEKYKDKDYKAARKIYKALPSGFSFNGVSVANRLKALDLYDYFVKYVGTYKCTYGYIEVRQISKSYGSWSSWYNNEKDGSLELWLNLNADGTVTLSGNFWGYRYTSYSVISAGVHSAVISEYFNINLSSKFLPKTLYDEDGVTIKNTGGTNFTLSYYELKKNEDVYFNYKYSSTYKFSK
ncbi:tetratricopeptide repeat protein [Anaerosporobacter sp.]|uniref:tetratricopeptide repeat protein n=1 Tax=Anaerosporobacter sp. TaxID=1872529 RepID=UPI00286F464F|nr:tetratricopeptide repeat protein [Anaerosporobacter sp.]